jgi:aminocarboxymuconate-semialdehyde decarboxylase
MTVSNLEAIDVHIHLTPPELLRVGGEGPAWRPSIEYDEHGAQRLVTLGGRPMRSIIGELSRIQIVLDNAHTRQIGGLVVSPWVSTLPLGLDRSAAMDVCRIQNESLAAAAAQAPGMVLAFGAVPMQDPEAAAEVLREAMALGLVGAEVTPSAANRWLGAPELDPFYATAAELGAVIFVHPGTHGLGIDVFDEYYLWNSVANPVETAIAAAHLCAAGFLERYPELKIILAHGGGVLPAVVGRLERAYEIRAEARRSSNEGPRSAFKRLRFDTVTHDRAQLMSLVDMVGADHVLLGSDYPFDMGTDDPVGEVEALGLAPAEQRLILSGNAIALFGSSFLTSDG